MGKIRMELYAIESYFGFLKLEEEVRKLSKLDWWLWIFRFLYQRFLKQRMVNTISKRKSVVTQVDWNSR